MKHILALFLLVAALPAVADMYKCKGADGRVTYSDTPCPAKSVSSKIRPDQQPTPSPTELAAKVSEGNQDSRPKESRNRRAPSFVPVPAPIPQPQTYITNCGQGGCWDNSGGFYARGSGRTYFDQSGGGCQMIGGMMQCP